MTIDRAIFLRICEDRGIEDYGTLQNLIGKSGVYRRLMERFEDADKRYNSGLFDFRKDTVTPSLKIDDKLLSDILSELYPPKSPYEFSVIGIEILGEVYEQFLGKVIRLTAGHQAKVEEKPEVRKAGGVHYTPTYIVDYIVKNTVGKLREGGPPARLTNVCRRLKMQPMSAQGCPDSTEVESYVSEFVCPRNRVARSSDSPASRGWPALASEARERRIPGVPKHSIGG
jgi:hypothetical protein